MNDLLEIEKHWLKTCGNCDGGLPVHCVCADDDPRPVIQNLIREIRRLRQRERYEAIRVSTEVALDVLKINVDLRALPTDDWIVVELVPVE